jgi:ethanolaminephosphotransferase
MTSLEASATAIILGECSFYATGRSRDLKTLDFSNTWNGMAEHNDVGTAIWGFVTNMTELLWWTWNSIYLIHAGRYGGLKTSIQSWLSFDRFACQSLFMSFGILAVMLSCLSMIQEPTALWSVSAPRLASTLITSAPFHLIIVIGGVAVVFCFERVMSFKF